MNEAIKIKDVSGKPYWAMQKAVNKPITTVEIVNLLNAAIKTGVVRPIESEAAGE